MIRDTEKHSMRDLTKRVDSLEQDINRLAQQCIKLGMRIIAIEEKVGCQYDFNTKKAFEKSHG